MITPVLRNTLKNTQKKSVEGLNVGDAVVLECDSRFGLKKGDTGVVSKNSDGYVSAKMDKDGSLIGFRVEENPFKKVVTEGGNSDSDSERMDAEYMEAVKKGDLGKCASMVEAAAKRNLRGTQVVDGNRNPLKVYHSSRNKNLKSFDLGFVPAGNVGFHFGPKEIADVIHRTKPGNHEPKAYYLDILNPMTFSEDCFGTSDCLFNELAVTGEILNHIRRGGQAYAELRKEFERMDAIVNDDYDSKYTDERYGYSDPKLHKLLLDTLYEAGYDGIVYANSCEGSGDICWIALDPHQVKSADPITYYDDGTVVPLSKRFDQYSEMVDESRAGDDVVARIMELVSKYDSGDLSANGVADVIAALSRETEVPEPVIRFTKAFATSVETLGSDSEGFDETIGSEYVDDIRDWCGNPVNEKTVCESDEKIPTSLSEDDVRGMEEMFGTTNDVRDAYFIMPDGKWLDFSNIPEETCREYSFWGPEHPLVGLYYGGKPSSAIRDAVVRLGMIRVIADSKYSLIEIGNEPTGSQIASMREFLHALVKVMYEGEGMAGDDPELVVEIGHGKFSRKYNVDQLKFVMGDIEKFFNGRSDDSVVRQFHESSDDVSFMGRVRDAMPNTKVVDSEGYPMMLYHGTSAYGFREFEGNSGFWASTSREYAEEYTESGGFGKPGVYRVFMNVENPLEVGNLDDDFDDNSVKILAENMGVTFDELSDWMYDSGFDWCEGRFPKWDVTTSVLFVEWLRELGFDGMHATEGTRRTETWCAFDSNQVKSAEEVTYSEDGTEIPAENRFDMTSNDINEGEDDGVEISKTDYGYEAKIGNQQVGICDITVSSGERIIEELSDSVGYEPGFREINPNKKTAYIEDISVDPEVRNCGIGTKMMKRIVDDYGSCQIVLRAFDTDGKSDPDRLVGFYRRFGFYDIASTDNGGTVMLRLADSPKKVVKESSDSDDDAYLAAAKTKNYKICRKMVEEKAKAAFVGSRLVTKDGMPIKLYHGTAFNIHKFEGGLDTITWVTPDIDYADVYADYDRHLDADNDGVIMSLYVYARNMVDIGDINEPFSEEGVRRIAKAIGCTYDELKSSIGKYSYDFLYEINEYVASIARKKGIDILVAKEGDLDRGVKRKVVTIGVLDFNNIKSADPITKYEDGTIVPLSKRFDFSTDDIREDTEEPVPPESAAEVPPEEKKVELEKPCWKNPDDWKKDEFLVEFKHELGYRDEYFPTKSYSDCADSVAREYTLEMPTDTEAREIEGDAVMLLIKSGLKDSIKVAHELGEIVMGNRKGGPRHKKLLKAMQKAYHELVRCSTRFDNDDMNESEESDAAFARWFRSSVVKDASGKPLVVYHGSSKSGITEFNEVRSGNGIFFTSSKEVANDYAVGKENQMYPCYLRIEHPFVIDAHGSKWSDMKFKEHRAVAKHAGYRWITPLEVIGYVTEVYQNEHPECDGIIIRNVVDTNASNVCADDYIVFNQKQIKSVENSGAFSDDTANIFESRV